MTPTTSAERAVAGLMLPFAAPERRGARGLFLWSETAVAPCGGTGVNLLALQLRRWTNPGALLYEDHRRVSARRV
ncbi:hypothetical protein DL240_17305 [Lujinxingia litoralis]|uniref:Uncharacterized protein n=1 Tax=Lujinxingia litoralis TaxID=2211119 RepID=A0A328C233_9DELT|nr:hypothetical protein DL240_17305 [Lujinxingia litoralis]